MIGEKFVNLIIGEKFVSSIMDILFKIESFRLCIINFNGLQGRFGFDIFFWCFNSFFSVFNLDL